MSIKYFAVCFLAVLVSADPRNRRDAPETTEDAFKEVISKAEVAVKEAGEHLSKMLGLDTNAPTGDQVVELIKNQTKAFTEKAEVVQRQIESELKELSNSTIGNAFSDLSKKLQETVTTFREQIEASGVGGQAVALQEKFQEGINTLIEEGKKLANNLEPQVCQATATLKKLTGDVIAQAVDALLRLKDEITGANSYSSPPPS